MQFKPPIRENCHIKDNYEQKNAWLNALHDLHAAPSEREFVRHVQ